MSEFDPNWKWGHVTRDGRKARIICKDRGQSGYTIVALAGQFEADIISARTWDGRATEYGDSPNDLLNAPAPKRRLERWVSFYSHASDGAVAYATTHETREQFLHYRKTLPSNVQCIACLHVTGEEGDGI